METMQSWSRGLRELGSWFVLEGLLPGATLFVLLTWLTWRFVQQGFGNVRQYAFAPIAGKWVVGRSTPKNWWSCTCLVGACTCLSAVARGLRRCCAVLLQAPLSPLA